MRTIPASRTLWPALAWPARRGRHATTLAALTAVGYLLFFVQLARRDLWSSHEARAGQHAQLMLDTGRWGMPTLYWGWSDYQKPPLYYWLVAAAGWLRGGRVDAWCIRLPAALSALTGVWMVYALGVSMVGQRCGLAAALVLATSLRYCWSARVGRIDMPLMLAVTTALGCLWFGYQSLRSRWVAGGGQSVAVPWRWLLPGYVAIAVAVLLKGPVGAVLPFAAALAFLLWERQPVWPWRPGFRQLADRWGLWWGLALTAAIAGPWFVWATVSTGGDFFRTFFLHHHLDRALGIRGLKPNPVWYYVPDLLAAVFPWSVLLVPALLRGVRDRRREPALRFCLAWLGAMFAFLSLVRFKRHDYLLPLLPAASLLIGRYVDRVLLGSRADRRWARAHGWVIVVVAAGVCTVLLAPSLLEAVPWGKAVASVVAQQRVEAGRAMSAFRRGLEDRHGVIAAICAVVLASAVSGLILLRRGSLRVGLNLSGLAWVAAFLLHLSVLLPVLEPIRSQRSLAALARRLCPIGQTIYWYGRTDHQLAFYLGRPLRWLANRDRLREVIARPTPVFVVAERDRFLQRRREWPDACMVVIADNTENAFGMHEKPMVLATNAAGRKCLRRTAGRHGEAAAQRRRP